MGLAATQALPRFTVGLASNADEIMAAQQLRYRIFAEEMGAEIDGGHYQIDHDRFDPFCKHLIVRDAAGAIIACTRLLTGEAAEAAGGFYSEHEFELTAIKRLIGRKLELGRTCVAAEHRNGSAIAALWSGLANFVAENNIDYLFGCASVSLDKPGEADQILLTMQQRYLSAPDLRVQSRKTYPGRSTDAPGKVRMPPLLKAYVSLGARACGDAYWDEDFHCADVFMLLNIKELHPRYRRRFLGPRLAG